MALILEYHASTRERFSLQLLFALLACDVVPFVGVLGEVVDLFGLVAEEVDVLLVALYAGEALVVVKATEEQGAVSVRRSEKGPPRVTRRP